MQDLSPELLDYISSHVDEPSDLLSFALTCQNLKDIIIPMHIDYRYIRCDLERSYLWIHLSNNPLLASGIRTLEIIDDYEDNSKQHVVPRIPHEETERSWWGIESKLLPAIRSMANLQKFRWFTNRVIEDVYTTLHVSHPGLKGLEVTCGGGVMDRNSHRERPLTHLKIWPNFHNLTQFAYSNRKVSWNSVIFNPQTQERKEAFIKLLHKNCPNLEDLQLDLSTFNRNELPGFFSNVKWPRLRRLNAHTIIIREDHQAFFAAHSNLQALCITTSTSRPFSARADVPLDYSALHNLLSLELDQLPRLTSPIASNLVSLSFELQRACFPPVIFDHKSDRLPPIARMIPQEPLDVIQMCNNLRNLVVKSHVPLKQPLTTLLRVSPPTLERLAFVDLTGFEAWVDPLWESRDLFKEQEDLAELRTMINLTHLGRVHTSACGLHPTSPDKQVLRKETIHRLSSAAPNLQFVALRMITYPGSWVKINRDATGNFLSYNKVSGGKYRDDVDFTKWGGHYRGARPAENGLKYDNACPEPALEDGSEDVTVEDFKSDKTDVGDTLVCE